jgi:hypothetical protein
MLYDINNNYLQLAAEKAAEQDAQPGAAREHGATQATKTKAET